MCATMKNLLFNEAEVMNLFIIVLERQWAEFISPFMTKSSSLDKDKGKPETGLLKFKWSIHDDGQEFNHTFISKIFPFLTIFVPYLSELHLKILWLLSQQCISSPPFLRKEKNIFTQYCRHIVEFCYIFNEKRKT